jgi:hypothetical protein
MIQNIGAKMITFMIAMNAIVANIVAIASIRPTNMDVFRNKAARPIRPKLKITTNHNKRRLMVRGFIMPRGS